MAGGNVRRSTSAAGIGRGRRPVAWMGLALLIAVAGRAAADGAAPIGPPETLIWTYTDLEELRANARTWHEVKGIDGFIFCMINGVGVPRWTSGAETIQSIHGALPRTVEALRARGITANFVHAGIDDAGWDWHDESRTSRIVPTFRALGGIARASGCRGVAIDTEPYSCGRKLWDPTAYPPDRRDGLRERVRRTGAEIMAAILAAFPEAEILVLPEGGYIAMRNSPGGHLVYEMWMDFFNGLIGPRPPGGITVLCECAYNTTTPTEIAFLDGATRGYVQAKCDDPLYWIEKCSLGFGALLSLKAADPTDRSVADFARQWGTMSRLSRRYRWVFAGESGFCHIAGYDRERDPNTVVSFAEPLADNADAYFKIIRDARARPAGEAP